MSTLIGFMQEYYPTLCIFEERLYTSDGDILILIAKPNKKSHESTHPLSYEYILLCLLAMAGPSINISDYYEDMEKIFKDTSNKYIIGILNEGYCIRYEKTDKWIQIESFGDCMGYDEGETIVNCVEESPGAIFLPLNLSNKQLKLKELNDCFTKDSQERFEMIHRNIFNNILSNTPEENIEITFKLNLDEKKISISKLFITHIEYFMIILIQEILKMILLLPKMLERHF